MRAPLALAAAFLAASCATTRPPAPATPALAPEEARALAALGHWRASGRIGVKSRAGGLSASFDWRETVAGSTVEVHGPFGAGATRLTRTSAGLRIEGGGLEPRDYASDDPALADALAARLGAPLPLERLRYWMLGIAAPGTLVTGARRSFAEDGWTVSVDATVPVATAPAALPRSLTLMQADTRIRVLVDAWDLAGP
jgi:outer membrane lipoprotein LolB